jgi:8-oxo-dGTP diphosphatase
MIRPSSAACPFPVSWPAGAGNLPVISPCDTRAVPLRSTCLCLLTRDRLAGDGGDGGSGARDVLLGHKKTGLGTGKIVGLGGHVEPDESAAEAAAREVKEESGLCVAADSLVHAAHVTFLFPARPSWDMEVAIFTAATWSGEPAETEEICPEWFPVSALPYDRMWQDARHWLPRVLAGERLRAVFSYAADCETLAGQAITPLR